MPLVARVRLRPVRDKTLVVVHFTDRTKAAAKFASVRKARRWARSYAQHRSYQLN